MTLRLDDQTKLQVGRIARRRGITRSQVVREAIEALVAKDETPVTAYDLMKDFIGVVHGGNPKRSENTGRQFTEMLRARRSQGKKA